MNSIQDWGKEIKVRSLGWLGDWGLAILVILVGAACFALGRLSALEGTRSPVSISQASASSLAAGGGFVASKTGEVYYFPWCARAQKIPPDSRVYFKSESDAKSAGYRAAKNCKGLDTAGRE
jgi:hypothetical protein